MSQKGMRRLAEHNLIPEVKDVQLERCTNFLMDKQNQTSFRARPLMRREALLELVHIDVCHVDTKSHARAQYFVMFIDEVVGLTTEDEGPSTLRLQGIPHESGKGNRPKAESGSSR